MTETLMSLILHNSKSSTSFSKYIQREQTRIEVEDAGFHADVSERMASQVQKMSGDAHIAEQQLFVSDMLFELSKEFVYKSYAAPDLHRRKLAATGVFMYIQYVQCTLFSRCNVVLDNTY